MTETLANGYSSESTQWELSNEYHDDWVQMSFVKSLHPCALDESSLSIRRVKVCVRPLLSYLKRWGSRTHFRTAQLIYPIIGLRESLLSCFSTHNLPSIQPLTSECCHTRRQGHAFADNAEPRNPIKFSCANFLRWSVGLAFIVLIKHCDGACWIKAYMLISHVCAFWPIAGLRCLHLAATVDVNQKPDIWSTL